MNVTAIGLILATMTTSTPCNPISSVRELSSALAGTAVNRRLFDLKADITHIRPLPHPDGVKRFSLAITDGDNAVVLAKLGNDETLPAPGDHIRCKGYVETNNRHARAILSEPPSVISHGERPNPLNLDIRELPQGKHAYAFVSVAGLVYDARPSETNDRYLLLSIVDGDNLVAASSYITEEESRSCLDLIGARVRVEGIYTVNDGTRHHLTGDIKLSDSSAINVIQPADADDTNTPPLRDLDNSNADEIPLFVRHHVTGRVTAIMDSRVLVLRPEGRYVCVELIGSKGLPELGSTITATGFPDTDLINVNLTKATWKAARCATPEEAPATPATASMLRVGRIGEGLNNYFGKRVSITGNTFTPHGNAENKTTLHIISDGTVFRIHLPFDMSPRIADGTTIQATGSCMLDSESWHKQGTTPVIRGFIIVARSPDDIKIIARPPWWNLNRLLAVTCTLLLCIIGITIWNRMLSKLADRRGKQLLKAQLAGVRSQMKVLERTRLAVELHDSIAQNLTAVSMELTTAELLGEGAPPDMRDHLGIARQTLKSCREELRNCIWDLRSNALEEMNIEKAISLALNPIAKKSKIAIRFPVSRRHVPDSVMHAVLRIIRELCANGITHGKASALRIAGKLDNGTLMFSIDDNGIGFDPENHPGVQEGHFGIQGIRERLLHLKGCISFFSAKGKGCKVRVEIPVNDDEEELPA